MPHAADTLMALGGAFVVAQALVVALLAELEYTGLRRSAPLAA